MIFLWCERWVERYILGERTSSHIFFREPAGANACTPLQTEIPLIGCVTLARLWFSALSKTDRVVLIMWSPCGYTPVRLRWPDAPSSSCLLIKMWLLDKAHEPKIHVICYITFSYLSLAHFFVLWKDSSGMPLNHCRYDARDSLHAVSFGKNSHGAGLSEYGFCSNIMMFLLTRKCRVLCTPSYFSDMIKSLAMIFQLQFFFMSSWLVVIRSINRRLSHICILCTMLTSVQFWRLPAPGVIFHLFGPLCELPVPLRNTYLHTQTLLTEFLLTGQKIKNLEFKTYSSLGVYHLFLSAHGWTTRKKTRYKQNHVKKKQWLQKIKISVLCSQHMSHDDTILISLFRP